jgi:hypothetical protein
MASRTTTPIVIDDSTSQASATPSGATLPTAFDRMMQPNNAILLSLPKDKCSRPTPTYNFNYNPHEPPNNTLFAGYSPYVFGEPLHDYRPVEVARLPKHHMLN